MKLGWPFTWVKKVLNPELAEHIEGDLQELYEDYMVFYPKWKAKLFYFFDCFQMLRPLLLKPFLSNSKLRTMLLHNFKLGYRNLLKYKNYTAINVIGLVLGFSAAITLLRVVQYEGSFDQFHADLDQIHRLGEYTDEYGSYYQTRTPASEKLKEEIPEIVEATRVFSPSFLWLEAEGKMLKNGITYVDPDFATMFSFEVIEGDLKKTLSTKGQIAITLDISKAYFGYEEALGKTLISSDGKTQYTVGAVLENPPANSSINYNLMLSWSHVPEWVKEAGDWQSNFMYSYLKFREGISVASLSDKFAQVGKANFPKDDPSVFITIPFGDFHKETSGNKTTVWTLTIIAAIILIIAFVNFINLLTSQSLNRLKEVAVNKVMGSKRFQIIFQFSVESALLFFISGIVALAISLAATNSINSYFGLHLLVSSSITTQLFIFSTLTSTIMGILAGLYPSIYLARKDIIPSLKGDMKKGSQRMVIQKALIVIQYTASIVLIAGAFLIWEQVSFMKSKNLAMDKDNILIVEMDFTSFPNIEKSAEKVKLLKQKLKDQSYIESAAFAWNMPGHYDRNYNEFDDPNGAAKKVHLRQTTIDADVVPSLNLEIVHGENFDATIKSEENVVIINEAAFEAMGWSDLNSRVIKPHGSNEGFSVKGVVKNFHYQSVAEEIEPMIYWYLGPDPVSRMIYVKYAAGKAEETIDFLKDNWSNVGSLASLNYHFLDTTYDELYRSEEKVGAIVSAFSFIGIFLASLGLLALASFTIRQRTKEIGIRKVMGGSNLQIASILSTQFLLLVIVAIAISYPAIWYFGHEYLQSFSYRTPISPLLYVIATIIVIIIGVLSVGLKAYSAASMNPSHSLRDE